MSLIQKKDNIKRELKELKNIKIESLSNKELIGNFREINNIKKEINNIRDRIRKEIADYRIYVLLDKEDTEVNIEEETEEKDGYIEKTGNIILRFKDEVIKAIKNVRKKLKKDEVKEELQEEGLWNQVVKKEGKIENYDSYMTILEDVMSYLEKRVEDGDKDAFELYNKMDGLIDIKVKEKIDEDKLKALEKLGFYDDIDKFYDVKKYFALYPQKYSDE